MGMDPFNFADALLGILAQRLAKRLCKRMQGGLLARAPDEIKSCSRVLRGPASTPTLEEGPQGEAKKRCTRNGSRSTPRTASSRSTAPRAATSAAAPATRGGSACTSCWSAPIRQEADPGEGAGRGAVRHGSERRHATLKMDGIQKGDAGADRHQAGARRLHQVGSTRPGRGYRRGSLPPLEQLNAIGASLSHERDIDRLLENILLAAKTITHADGGTLYRITEDEASLRFEIVRTDSLKIALGGTSGNPISLSDLPLYPARTARPTRWWPPMRDPPGRR
jgi:hypothetical protein